MVAARSFEIAHPPDEQRMLLSVTWKEYVILRELLDSSGLKMTYSRGALEIMRPSPQHELWKTNIARLVELFAYISGIDLRGYGSTTFKKEAKQRGCEPDECYLIGKKLADYPEIVIEVIFTNPLLDKLVAYAAFGVSEVWIFRDGAFAIHRLDAATSSYELHERSALIPSLDLSAVAKYAQREDITQALREFENEIRATKA